MKNLCTELLIIVIIISACNNYNPVDKDNKLISSISLPYNIDIEKGYKETESIPLSNIAQSIEYIALETNPASQLRNIDHIVLCDSFIFVNDYTKLLQFDSNGKFIRKIGSYGRGPGEYSYVNDFCIEKENGKIYILNVGSILEFNFEGSYIGSKPVERNSTRFVLSDSNKIMLYPFNLPGNMFERPYSWYLLDLNGNDIISIPNYFKRVNSPGLMIRESPLYSFNNIFHFMEYGIDTLYCLRNTKPEPYAIFNFGDMKMDHDLSISASDRITVLKKLEQKLRINSILESDDYLFFRLKWGFSDSALCGIFNKKTLRTTFLKENGFTNDIDGGLTFWPKYIDADRLLVDYFDSFVFLEEIGKMHPNNIKSQNANEINPFDTFKKLVNSIKETDNPVLMMVRLKK